MSSLPDCTLTTACFNVHHTNENAFSIQKIKENSDTLMAMPCYLVIFCDKDTISILKEKREEYGFLSLTKFIQVEMLEIWSFQFLKKVQQNRATYWPSRDSRSNEYTHLIQCNKFDFLLQTIDLNPFQTSKFGWIDCFLGINGNKICENYTTNNILYVLHNITNKFHILIPHAYNKQYKLPENKREYYSNYKYVACGCLFTCSDKIGRPILNRLKDIVVETTNAGYGHGEEMFFLEVLDEYKNDINKSYGDYGQILNNFIKPTKNFHIIYYNVLRKYVYEWYFDEAYECAKSLIDSFESINTICSWEIYMKILFEYYLAARMVKKTPDEVKVIVDHINDICNNNPLMKTEFDKDPNYCGFPNLIN